jgi:hypothetical protein
MSIYLSIKAEDAEVESLLKFLKTEFPNPYIDEQISTLERTILWLRAAQEYGFGSVSTSPNVVQLALQDDAPASSLPAHTPVQSQV